MRDDQLREGLAAWLAPVQQAPAPDMLVIRRRLRRRRARQAAAGTALCAVAAGAAALIHVSAAPEPAIIGHGPVAVPACRGSQLRAEPEAVLVRSGALSMEPVPLTYLLRIQNTGRTACSLHGWPKVAVVAPPAMRAVPVRYATVSMRATKSGEVPRVVEPAQVVLSPGARAVATATVTYPLDEVGCGNAVLSVTPPQSGRRTLIRRSQLSGTQRLPLICGSSTITVSPVYPASVPPTRNYPAAAPRQSPASVSTSAPAAHAGPQAAPFFVEIRGSKAIVSDWRTGRVTAVIPPPAGASQRFTGVAGAGDDRTFVLATGAGPSRFYQLVLSQQGAQDQPLTPLPVPAVAGSGTPFALSDDGSELALALPQRGATATDEIMVVSLVTGSARTWRSPDPGMVYGLSWADPGSSPSRAWAAHDRLLFGWNDTARTGQSARRRSGLRLLDTTAPGSGLLASRLVIPASARVGALRMTFSSPLIAPGGTVVFVTMVSHPGVNAQAAVVEFSADTGRPLGVVTPLTGESGMGTWCGALWADPSGRRALAACGMIAVEVNGTRFTPQTVHFATRNFSAGPNFFAW